MSPLFWKALLAFVAMPGMVGYVVPWLLLGPARRGPVHPEGLGVLAAGTLLLLGCVLEFARSGKGTLAPWSPPRHLVTGGLYRFSRNPMYVAVQLVLWGWALGFRSGVLAGYALAVFAAFHLRIVLGEEPWLERTHGEAWRAYRARVPRWLGPVRGA
jgi:protein-S-isoprenylcysteine O-methyltransferase Ste14